MHVLSVLKTMNYGLVLIYGLFLSSDISGGWKSRKQKRLIFILCPVFLMIQGLCWIVWNISTVEQLYPLITHLPLILILIFALKKTVGTAIVSVSIGYLCCQLPRWVKLAVFALSRSELAGEICYTVSIIPIFFLLRRWFVRPAHEAMSGSARALALFGSLPVAYYIFDYATSVYSEALHMDIQALSEFLPTALILFYVLFLTAYHVQAQDGLRAELHRSLLETELKQAHSEMENLRRIEKQTAIYQHDMRHHMTMLSGFLAANNPQQAEDYIKQVQANVEAITPRRFCENEIVNLLCSAFVTKAEQLGVRIKITAKVPIFLSVSDTDLCAVLSNGIENALRAAAELEEPCKWVELYCGIKHGKLLIEIKNPYSGKRIMQNGLPITDRSGHGFGCSSIRAITEHNRGLCTFEAESGVFTLRVVLPVNCITD